jgi:hypothetical protein
MGLLDTIFKDFRFYRDSTANCYVGAFDGENNEVKELDKELMNRYIKGQSIVDIIKDDFGEWVSFVLSNGLILRAHSNEGCGGCSNGWYCLDTLIDTRENGNIITKIEVKNPEYAENGTYSMFIYSNDKRIVTADFSGCDNGYYGTGIWVEIVIPEEMITKICNGEVK